MTRPIREWWFAPSIVFIATAVLLFLGWLWLTHTDVWRSKSEGAIVQYAELAHRGTPLTPPEFFEHAGHHLVCVRGVSSARIWIMLDPHFAPYYKQLPLEQFTLTSTECDQIARLPYTNGTVRSHINPQPP